MEDFATTTWNPVTSADVGGGASWSTWIQNVAGGVIDKAAGSKWVQPYEIDKLRLQQFGTGGYYQEGQRNQQGGGTPAGGGFLYGINSNMLLLAGAAVVAVLILRK